MNARIEIRKGGRAAEKRLPSEARDAIAAALARDRAEAWARSVPGTPYGSTTPNLTEEVTPYQEGHRH